jgi:hypothetical protein
MTMHGAARALLLVLTLAAPPGPASASDEQGDAAARRAAASPAYVATDPRDDPRLHHTGAGERTLGRVGDAVFSRPIYFVRLVAGRSSMGPTGFVRRPPLMTTAPGISGSEDS